MYKLTQSDILGLKGIIGTPAVAGNELPLDNKIYRMFQTRFPRWHIEKQRVGNIIAQQTMSPAKPTLLFSCHKDRIGFIVDECLPNNQFKLAPIGGISTVKSGSPVIFYAQYPLMLEGTLDIEINLLKTPKAVVYAHLKDLGSSKVRIGDPVAFKGDFITDFNTYITSPYLDDSIGVFVCLKLVEYFSMLEHTPQNFNLAVAFSTMEELGLRGIASVLEQINPDLMIAIDVMDTSPTCLKGKGPALVMFDSGIILPIQLREQLESIAKQSNIPLQAEVFTGGGTSDWEISMEKGYLTFPLGLPTDNIHTLIESVSIQDLEYLITYTIQLTERVESLIK